MSKCLKQPWERYRTDASPEHQHQQRQQYMYPTGARPSATPPPNPSSWQRWRTETAEASSSAHEEATPLDPGPEPEPESEPAAKKCHRKPRVRCGECDGCLRSECGECRNCVRFKRFGGDGSCKAPCLHRKCTNLLPHGSHSPFFVQRPNRRKRKYGPPDSEDEAEAREAMLRKRLRLKFRPDKPDHDVPWHRSRKEAAPTKRAIERRCESVREYMRIRVCRGDADEALTVAVALADSLREFFAKTPLSDDEGVGDKRARGDRTAGGGEGKKRGGVKDAEAHSLRRLGRELSHPFDQLPPDPGAAEDGGRAVRPDPFAARLAMALVRWEHYFDEKVQQASTSEECDAMDIEVQMWFVNARRRIARRKRAVECAAGAAAVQKIARELPCRKEIRRIRERMRSIALELERREGHLKEELRRDAYADTNISFEHLLRMKRTNKKGASVGYLGEKKIEKLLDVGIPNGRELLRIWDGQDDDEGCESAITRLCSKLSGKNPRNIVGRWVEAVRKELKRRDEVNERTSKGSHGEGVDDGVNEGLAAVRAKVDQLEDEVQETLDPAPKPQMGAVAAIDTIEERRRMEMALRMRGRKMVCVRCGGEAFDPDRADSEDLDVPDHPVPVEVATQEMLEAAANGTVLKDAPLGSPNTNTPNSPNGDDHDDPHLDFSRLLHAKDDSHKSNRNTCAALIELGPRRLERLLSVGISSGRDLVRIWVNRYRDEAGLKKVMALRNALTKSPHGQMVIVERWAKALARELVERDRRHAATGRGGEGGSSAAMSEKVLEEPSSAVEQAPEKEKDSSSENGRDMPNVTNEAKGKTNGSSPPAHSAPKSRTVTRKERQQQAAPSLVTLAATVVNATLREDGAESHNSTDTGSASSNAEMLLSPLPARAHNSPLTHRVEESATARIPGKKAEEEEDGGESVAEKGGSGSQASAISSAGAEEKLINIKGCRTKQNVPEGTALAAATAKEECSLAHPVAAPKGPTVASIGTVAKGSASKPAPKKKATPPVTSIGFQQQALAATSTVAMQARAMVIPPPMTTFPPPFGCYFPPFVVPPFIPPLMVPAPVTKPVPNATTLTDVGLAPLKKKRKRVRRTLPPKKPRRPPPSASWRHICKACGRHKTEHCAANTFHFGLGSCKFQSCGKCGAREEFHRRAGTVMGYYCKLKNEEGGSTDQRKRYWRMIRLLTGSTCS